jgi:hypothetical protein
MLSSAAMFNVQAADWSLTGGVNPSLKYDDNIFMRDTDKLGDYHASMSPTLKAAYETDRTDTSLSTGFVMDRYHSSNQLDNDNPFVNLNTAYKTQRTTWELGLGYVERSSRKDAADDTGDFETNSTSTTESISPSFSYQLTERDSLSLSASYSEETYSTNDFSDSKNRTISTHWQHQFTERLNGGVSLSVNNSKSTGLFTKTDDETYRVLLTSAYNVSEIWTVNGSVGLRQIDVQQTDFLGGTTETTDTGPSLAFDIAYQTDLNQVSISLSRSVSPSSTGDVNEQDKISIAWGRSLSEKLSASINASFQTTSSALDTGSDDREYISFSPSINWAYSPDSSLSLSYNYRQQKESFNNTEAISNAIMLTFNYDWHGINVSR